MPIHAVDVFCGSKTGTNPLFIEHTKQLGHLLAERKISIIYGGGNKGLMAVVANAALERNGKVVGIIPKLLSEWEHQHDGLTELHIVENMHVRKELLYEKCDAAIILPGGYGTLDEVFEILTWNQLHIHDKKIFFLNSDGFYDHLLAHIAKMYAEGFLYNDPFETLIILTSPGQLLQHL